MTNQETGILLLAFGGPNSLEEVEPFLNNIFPNDKLPLSFREEIKERYRIIGGKSPLQEITTRQATALKANLQKKGKFLEVGIGMRYWHPFVPEAIRFMVKKEVKEVLCLVLSPFTTPAIEREYREVVSQAINEISLSIEVKFIPPWNTNNLYLQAVVGKIKEGLANFPISSQKLVPLIFSAHSLPLKYAESDPYVEEIKKTIHEIMKLIENKEWYLAFQSPGREGEWLSPEIGVVLDRLGKSGKKEILVVPLSFVSDHLETLYDLDIILKKKADKLGINFQRVASFNDSADFIEVLSEVIIAFIES